MDGIIAQVGTRVEIAADAVRGPHLALADARSVKTGGPWMLAQGAGDATGRHDPERIVPADGSGSGMAVDETTVPGVADAW